MSKVAPTTKAQVSGHKFLVRRTELGLLCGDVRMIHDPIAKRLRATGFGVAAVVLIAVGSLALALFSPEHDPGDARILRSDVGQFYVRDEDTLYPAANLVSARLIAGEPAEPAKISDALMQRYHLAQPVGIPDAPGVLLDVTEPIVWEVCADQRPKPHADTTPATVEFALRDAPLAQLLESDQALLARVDDTEWVIREHTRIQLPPRDTPEGRVLRRGLAISPDTPRWLPTMDVLQVIPEQPAWLLPTEGALLRHEEEFWLRDAGGVQKLTTLQSQLLRDHGLTPEHIRPAEVHEFEDAQPALHLPATVPAWLDPSMVCVHAKPDAAPDATLPSADATSIGVGIITPDTEWGVQGSRRMHGQAHVTHFRGMGTSVAVATGNGVHLLGESGTRHIIVLEDAHALGIQRLHPIPWLLLRLLPEGSVLDAETAQRPITH